MQFTAIPVLLSLISSVLGIDNSAMVSLAPAANSTLSNPSTDSGVYSTVPALPSYEAAGNKMEVTAAAISALIAGVLLSV